MAGGAGAAAPSICRRADIDMSILSCTRAPASWDGISGFLEQVRGVRGILTDAKLACWRERTKMLDGLYAVGLLWRIRSMET